MLTLNNISKSYKLGKEEVPILKHINLTVKAGEFLAIMGAVRFREVYVNEYYRLFGQADLRNLYAGPDGCIKRERRCFG